MTSGSHSWWPYVVTAGYWCGRPSATPWNAVRAIGSPSKA